MPAGGRQDRPGAVDLGSEDPPLGNDSIEVDPETTDLPHRSHAALDGAAGIRRGPGGLDGDQLLGLVLQVGVEEPDEVAVTLPEPR